MAVATQIEKKKSPRRNGAKWQGVAAFSPIALALLFKKK